MIRIAMVIGFSAIVTLSISNVCADRPQTFESLAKPFLQRHCLGCHGSDAQEGQVSFHNLAGVDANNAELWKRVWEQVALKEMPPKDEIDQPAAMDRLRLSNWITSELATALKEKGGFQSHLHPSKGNHLDHDLLFGDIPKGLEPASTPARIWRITPQEHLTRLNALINLEPAFDKNRPGLRTRGDHIPPNLQGKVQVYFALDRIIGWLGASAAYTAAISGFPSVLSTADHHGPGRITPTFIQSMARRPPKLQTLPKMSSDSWRTGPVAEPHQFEDSMGKVDQEYKHESLRGSSLGLFYSKSPKRPLTPIYDLMREPGVSDEKLTAAVEFLFEALTCRPPTEKETKQYLDVLKEAITDIGKEEGVILGLTPIFLDRNALFRSELAEQGTPDKYGRVMLQDMELALAINAAFSYLPPDETLKQAAIQGRMKNRSDVKREVTRILEDDSNRKPRVLQFFKEYFDYDRAGYICKDMNALKQAGGSESGHYKIMFGMIASTDRLIELILKEDKEVLHELLTTDRVVLYVAKTARASDARYFSEFEKLKYPPKPKKHDTAAQLGYLQPPKGELIHVRVSPVRFLGGEPKRTLTTLPADQRMGILTHPSWLVSHSDAMDNHAILRGRWIRERLLGGAVPDVPITVDAMLPDEPNETLRHRMRVTREDNCWKCHQKMDLASVCLSRCTTISAFYRKQEQGKDVDTTGAIIDSGDPNLDGPVKNPLEMIQKLARSRRVKQVFVRHAFRFWMGRNETINDAPVIQDACRAYEGSGGSMKALIASLLTSDAFLYRKVDRGGDR